VKGKNKGRKKRGKKNANKKSEKKKNRISRKESMGACTVYKQRGERSN
jgi:hypothetical protein